MSRGDSELNLELRSKKAHLYLSVTQSAPLRTALNAILQHVHEGFIRVAGVQGRHIGGVTRHVNASYALK